jgi:hypothetical protein
MRQARKSSNCKSETGYKMLVEKNPDGSDVHSFAHIVNMTQCRESKFKKVREYWEKRGEVLYVRMGAPKKITEDMIHQVQFETLMNPMRSRREVTAHTTEELGTSISRTSVDKIKHDLHFRFLPGKRLLVMRLYRAS